MNQEKALAILKSGRNVLLTGSAGAGKTYVLNQYIQYLKSHKIPVAITASTGIAATHLNGMTIHSWSGIGVKDQLSYADLKHLQERSYLKKSLEHCKVLIIDEISMLHRRQFEMVDLVLKTFKKNEMPFGGIQIVLCGDFFQLPPVTDRQEENRDRFAFMSPLWVQADLQVCYLTEQNRQLHGKDLNDILNEMRAGLVTHDSMDKLKATMHNELMGAATRLFTHNADVDELNFRFLENLSGKKREYTARTKGNRKLLETLKKTVLTYEKLPLKIGSKVMFVKNNYDEGYMNGTLGEVVSYTEETELPVVRLNNGREVVADEQVWSVDDEKGRPLATFTQVPLRLAWAITVHKSQGMTLDAAEVDLSRTFERGQGYVALSRLRSLEGLKLTGINLKALESDPLVLKADNRFRELSDQTDASLDFETLQASFNAFILQCGGSLEPVKIRGHKRTAKADTYALTAELVQKGYTLDKIAKERGLSPGTIASHLVKIRERGVIKDFSAFHPGALIVQQVSAICEQIKSEQNPENFAADGSIKLGTVYGMLQGSINYEDIRLAMLFA